MLSLFITASLLSLAATEHHSHSKSKRCSQSTAYEFVTQTHTVTMGISTDITIPAPISDAAPSTVVYTSVIWVTPSPMPHYPLSNGTQNATHPTSSTNPSVLPSSSARFSETSSAAPAVFTHSVQASQAVATSSAEVQIVASPSQAAVASPVASTSPNTGNVAATSSNSGQATFYGGNVSGGMCSFTGYTIPTGIYGTALSDSNWANAGNCGACISVKGPSGNVIKAMIVDQCPGCGNNHLDLFPDAFSALAPQSEGITNVSWSIVPCGITTPIVLKNKSGVSAYWFSMQVENSNEPVSKLEVSTDGGRTWLATTRQQYNFFEISSGTGTISVTVRITSTSGSTIVVSNVPISSDSTMTAASNFS